MRQISHGLATLRLDVAKGGKRGQASARARTFALSQIDWSDRSSFAIFVTDWRLQTGIAPRLASLDSKSRAVQIELCTASISSIALDHDFRESTSIIEGAVVL